MNLSSNAFAQGKAPVSGIILAGGASRRMGQAKAALPWGSSTLLQHLLQHFVTRLDPLVVVGEEKMSFPELPQPVQLVFDPISHQGPLVGFAHGLKQVPKNRPVFLTGCDFPFLQNSIVDFLLQRLEDQDGVVISCQGILQPLAGLYQPRIQEIVTQQATKEKRSLKELLSLLQCKIIPESDWLRVDPAGQMLTNINTPDEYAHAHQQYLSTISSSERA